MVTPSDLLNPTPAMLTLEARSTHSIRAVMLPTSLSTFLLLMSALHDRLRRILDTTWPGWEGHPQWTQSPGSKGINHPPPTNIDPGGWLVKRLGVLLMEGITWEAPPPGTNKLSPLPPHPRYLMQLLTLRGQLGHDGFHAASAGTQCGLLGLTWNSCAYSSEGRGFPTLSLPSSHWPAEESKGLTGGSSEPLSLLMWV